MRYISTRGRAPALTFSDAMLTGLARDGGLYVPESIPQLPAADIAALEGLPFEEAAARVIRPFTGDSFTEDELRGALERAYAGFRHAARAPLVQLAPGHHLLELFHGPTLAFKDVALQLVGRLFDHELARRGERATILVATSGDTGSAAIAACVGRPNLDVVVLHPAGRVLGLPLATLAALIVLRDRDRRAGRLAVNRLRLAALVDLRREGRDVGRDAGADVGDDAQHALAASLVDAGAVAGDQVLGDERARRVGRDELASIADVDRDGVRRRIAVEVDADEVVGDQQAGGGRLVRAVTVELDARDRRAVQPAARDEQQREARACLFIADADIPSLV